MVNKGYTLLLNQTKDGKTRIIAVHQERPDKIGTGRSIEQALLELKKVE